MVKVKLSKGRVVNGGVWAAGSIVEVDDETAKMLIADGDELVIEKSATPAPAQRESIEEKKK